MRSAEPPSSSGSAGPSGSTRSAMPCAWRWSRPCRSRRRPCDRRCRPSRRQLAAHAALELGGLLGKLARYASNIDVPGARARPRPSPARPRLPDVVRNLQRLAHAVGGEHRLARRANSSSPSGSPWAFAVPARFGEPLPITVRHDQRRREAAVAAVGGPVGRHRHRAVERFDVVAVDVGDHVPAVGLEARARCRRRTSA